MTGKRLLVIASEPLWPAVHGGRVDPWRRYQALKALGWELSLACWYKVGEEPSAEDMAAMSQLFQPVLCFPKAHGPMGALRRFAYLPLYSTHVTSRLLGARTLANVVSVLKGSPPDAIVLEQVYGLPLAKALARRFAAPLLIRSHNIEHRYMSGQSASAVGLGQKVQLAMAAAHLESMETRAFKDADWVFDISADDMAEWQAKGVERISWAPTFFLRDQMSSSAGAVDAPYAAVFNGEHRRDRGAVLVEHYNAPPLLRAEKGKWRNRAVFKLVAENIPDDANRVEAGTPPVARYVGHSDYGKKALADAKTKFTTLLAKAGTVEDVSFSDYDDTEGHIQGSHVMAATRDQGVIDADLRHHDIKNLLVGGSGAFPSNPPANPSLTIAALSLRAADRLLA